VAPFAPFQHAQLESVVLGSWDPGKCKSTIRYSVQRTRVGLAACGSAREQQIIFNDGSLASNSLTPPRQQWAMVNGQWQRGAAMFACQAAATSTQHAANTDNTTSQGSFIHLFSVLVRKGSRHPGPKYTLPRSTNVALACTRMTQGPRTHIRMFIKKDYL
jgi:hypothetical protein